MRGMKDQMELTFDARTSCQRTAIPRSRVHGARWWFKQMRQVVDRALDRERGRKPAPEQVYFGL